MTDTPEVEVEARPADPAIAAALGALVAERGGSMRLSPEGGLPGFHNPADKPVLSCVAARLDAAGRLPTGINLTKSQAYGEIERAILDLPQREAETLDMRNFLPPPHVHMMARKRGVFFDFRNADIAVSALAAAGTPIADRTHHLDFGCSSGRTVRTLDLAYPNAFWHGADPVAESIAFARMAFPRIAFRVSPQNPPLPYADSSFDGVVALSVWSHFSAAAGTAWLAEMRRIVRPGGVLLFTTHGWTDIAKKLENDVVSLETFAQIRDGLSAEGFFFHNNIKQGHNGLDTTDWGTTFMTRDWVEANYLGAGWEIAHCAFGQWGNRQDVYVLRAI